MGEKTVGHERFNLQRLDFLPRSLPKTTPGSIFIDRGFNVRIDYYYCRLFCLMVLTVFLSDYRVV